MQDLSLISLLCLKLIVQLHIILTSFLYTERLLLIELGLYRGSYCLLDTVQHYMLLLCSGILTALSPYIDWEIGLLT